MDNTYKTNKYSLSLLDIVHVTSIRLNFNAGFVLLSSERENNFILAFWRLRGLLLKSDALPKVIASDIDLAIGNAINFVFLEAYHILY